MSSTGRNKRNGVTGEKERPVVRERELRRRCRTLLNELDIRPPLDVVELCRRVGESRGKPIRLVSHPIPVPGPFGVWVAISAFEQFVPR